MIAWLVIDKSDSCFAVVQYFSSFVWLETEFDLVIKYVEGGEGKKGGGKAISDLLEGGGGRS